MNIYKLKYKLDSLKLKEIFSVISNYVERRLVNLNNIEILKSKFLGYTIIAKNNNKQNVYLFTYYDDDGIMQINPIINEYRIFDILEDIFQEDVILGVNQNERNNSML